MPIPVDRYVPINSRSPHVAGPFPPAPAPTPAPPAYPRVLALAKLPDDETIYLYDSSTQSATAVLPAAENFYSYGVDMSPDGAVWLAARFDLLLNTGEFLVWVDGVLTATALGVADNGPDNITDDGALALLTGGAPDQHAYKCATGGVPVDFGAGSPFGMSGDGSVFATTYTPDPFNPFQVYALINVAGVEVQIGVDYGNASNVSKNGRWVSGWFNPAGDGVEFHPFIYDRDTDTLTVRNDVNAATVSIADDGTAVGGTQIGDRTTGFKMTPDGVIVDIEMHQPYRISADARVIIGRGLEADPLQDAMMIDALPMFNTGYDFNAPCCSNVLP